MASWPREGADREFEHRDLPSLFEVLFPVRPKYRFFGLQIGVTYDEIKVVEANYSGAGERLLEILSVRLVQESALTCSDIVKALKSRTVHERTLADEFEEMFGHRSVTDQRKRKIDTENKSSKEKKAKVSTMKPGSELITQEFEEETAVKSYPALLEVCK